MKYCFHNYQIMVKRNNLYITIFKKGVEWLNGRSVIPEPDR